MPEPDCWLQNSDVRGQLSDYFATIDEDLSTYFEENPTVREEHLESRLATLLEIQGNSKLQLPLARIQRERARIHLKPINFSIRVSHITSGETAHGADIGIVAELNIPGEFRSIKAVLIQSKKLYPDRNGIFHEKSVYKEIFSNQNNPQWKRLLDKTPSSVYFLYNPYKLRLKRGIKLLGTRVITAQYISGVASAIQNPVMTAEEAFNQGKILSNWFIEDFICCRIGDTRDEIINIARGRNADFPVRYTITISITSEDTRPELFSHM